MSSKDDPSVPADKTVIRAPRPRQRSPAVPENPGGVRQAPTPPRESTVFDPGVGRRMPTGWSSGTVIHQGAAPDAAAPAASVPALQQEMLLDATDGVKYTTANPILAAAAPLLMLFGQLRLMPVERQAPSLAEHIAEAIGTFDREMARAGIAEEDSRIAKFALCETADDLVGNLPWPKDDAWGPHSLVLQFFHTKPTGAGFYEALNKILGSPEGHHDLLELMHACLSLGFEGQYRGRTGQRDTLERVRRDVYDTIRYFRPGEGDDISPHWQGMAATMPKPRARLPLWAIAAAAATLVTAAFFALRVLITDEGDVTAGELLALTPSTPVTIERASVAPIAKPAEAAPPPPAVPDTTQIDRIRAALAKEIAVGGLTVGTKGDFIVVEVNNQLLFASGQAELKDQFQPIAADIATALDAEPGPIRIVGHTDNVKPKKSSQFKSNFDLSVARAKAVQTMMAKELKDPSRIAVDGKGEDEPIADNATPDGRAKNRRVDVMIPKEETL
ncbi:MULTISPECIES: type VI secretion system protein TssL, long form [unclassified Mesorhizobium]|uniref:type VI secretion system protein TssL, long form n=1 Tax=unclassified Mesorhizobium TaxID=325217 RepID=UPI000F7576F7|nr:MULTISPECIES: type VI secretion system protein TssL, long form [unclassified Mesorhizobium]AZO25454.1 type VI secretion system protein TssL [Mesorhizobium sp. M1E.F.Ca.ET.045.02.1.1]RUW34304.1 type VI secretion system protein TssL [Mesorhizobium sp. M1E.F.Ca.ET.041.01.1.1]RWD79248.1 MAG: type VI secretion system protein TssL [Mesorhizobium sp.]RWD82245.1 MAG: type VI secretion system protein TssL [Mesorhizobium sp.]TIV48516.1 MAG: type VI secretion system protein TssL [Mesorhizobium sp.]